MGIFLNPGNDRFRQALNSQIYVDKSELISVTNKRICSEQKYICVSRPRRFGKSVNLGMLAAYYSKGCDSRELFDELAVSKDESYLNHLNKYNVIYLKRTKVSSNRSLGSQKAPVGLGAMPRQAAARERTARHTDGYGNGVIKSRNEIYRSA